jgi:gas vesicle protein
MNNKMWIGIAIGAGVGVVYALTARSKRSRWDRFDAREVTQRIADNREDLVERGKNMMERIRIIYEEGRKVVDDANEIWSQGRKMVGA